MRSGPLGPLFSLGVLAFATALAACGGGTRPADLDDYEDLRATLASREVATSLPKLTAAADALFQRAEAAFDAGHPQEAAHLARLARYRFLAAEAYSGRKSAQIRLAEVANRQRLLTRHPPDARRRERLAVEEAERTRRMNRTQARVNAMADGDGRARLRIAFEALRAAGAHDAARLAPADELQAVTALDAALVAAERKGPPLAGELDVGVLAERAVMQCQRLTTDVAPRYEEEKRRLAMDLRLREVLAQAAGIPEVEARLEGRGLVLTVRQLFADGTTEIMEHRRPLVDRVAALLATEGHLRLRVEGHTDARADREAARRTSEARAEAVRDRLVADGVAPDRVTAEGRGGAEPVADDRTHEGKARNRRVEIVLLRGPLLAAPTGPRANAPAPETPPQLPVR